MKAKTRFERHSVPPHCIRGHTKATLRHGVTRQELMEAIWVAAEMRAGAAYAHSTIAVTAVDEVEGLPPL
jgi:alkylhydroperoxidase/carboxymuconolactone decarboxylase family protein YurZ